MASDRAGETSIESGGGRTQAGYATVWALAWMACLLSVVWLSLILAAAVARQHHLDGSADLIAVSAASRLQVGADACAVAGDVAAANGVRLRACSVAVADVTVVVSDWFRLPGGMTLQLTSQARAGPG